MNKKLFLKVSFLFLLLSLTISFFIGRHLINKSLETYHSTFESLVNRAFDQTTRNIQNDLLNENVRPAKVVLERGLSDGFFSDYGIFKDDVLVDSSNSFSLNQKTKSRYIREIAFSQGGPKWGRIEFLRSDSAKDIFVKDFSIGLLSITTAQGFITVLLILFLLTLISSSGKIIFSVLSGVQPEKTWDSLSLLWSPLLHKIRLVIETEKKISLELVEYKKQEEFNQTLRQIAHDIRSPLSVINLAIKKTQVANDDVQDLIMSATERINAIANNLLETKDTRQLHSDELDDTCSTNITESLQNLVKEYSLLTKHKSIKINFDIPPKHAYSKIGKADFERSISNLLNNSIEAVADTEGEISVSLRENKNELSITILDNGKGIPEHILDKVGEKNFSYNKEELQTSGSGLGVYQAKKTMEDAGGQFVLNSKVGVGTMIILRLISSAHANLNKS